MSEVKRLAYLGAGTALLLLVVFVNPPTHTTFMYVLHKSAHPIVFAAIALIYIKLARTNGGDWWKPYFRAFGVVLVCGAGTEILQSFFDRDPLLEDVVRDATGGSASLAIASLVQRSALMRPMVRLAVWLLATAASFAAALPLLWCVCAYANRDLLFPTILEYRSPLDTYFVKVWTGRVSGVRLPDEWAVHPDEKAIKISLENGKPGIRFYEPYPDWRGYGTVSVEATNPNAMPVDLVVRLNAESPDYCDVPFELEPRTRSTLKLRIDETDPARPCRELNRSHIAGMAIFALKTMEGGRLYVNRIGLE
jgi:hypothetical protein